jgi:hypothetical protein
VATCSSAVSGRTHQEPAPKICDSHASDLILALVGVSILAILAILATLAAG